MLVQLMFNAKNGIMKMILVLVMKRWEFDFYNCDTGDKISPIHFSISALPPPHSVSDNTL